jgi:hypothetical protein
MKKLLLVPLFFLAGCMTNYRLPEVQGERIVYHRTDPLGGTTIEATGVKVTKTFVTADHASWNTVYPQWSIQLSVDNFKQRRDPADKKVSVDEEEATK